MSKTPDFTESEAKLIEDTLAERYGKSVETEHVDIEMPSKDDEQLYVCPAVYWEHKDCHFVLAKTGEGEFASQFFYGPEEQFSTGKDFYDDLSDCLLSTLRVQADHELKKQGAIK
ncbi:MAG: hypothetical protein OEY52_05975 [Gammaproteobacteria bacterium]|nr:hypothetical protein [Gammaproteobacteria bacterium]